LRSSPFWIPACGENDAKETIDASMIVVILAPASAGIQYAGVMSIQPATYVMASQRNGTLYVGVTGALRDRVYQHREALIDGFTKKYGVKTLVHFEFFASMPAAIAREKQLKKMLRKAKLTLIESGNPQWRDLWLDIQ
jgi:putative endonuclease